MPESDGFLAELDRIITELLKRGGGSDPWALYLIRALWPYPSGTQRQDILRRIEVCCTKAGRKLNPSFEQTVQRTFNIHNSDRRGPQPNHPLFHCNRKLGSGTWAVHHDNAKAWMTKRGYGLG